MDEDGEFQCRSGGRELLDIFVNDMALQPVHPIYFALTDFGMGDDAIHIQNIR